MKAKRENTIYIAGPMTGLPNYNYDAFHRAAGEWRNPGWIVNNPAESFQGRQDLPYARCMRNAIKLVMRSSAMALLPGWETSRGACMEVLIAERQGYEFFDANTGDHIPSPQLNANPIPAHSSTQAAS